MSDSEGKCIIWSIFPELLTFQTFRGISFNCFHGPNDINVLLIVLKQVDKFVVVRDYIRYVTYHLGMIPVYLVLLTIAERGSRNEF